MVSDNDFERLEEKIDELGKGLNDLRVSVENRVTKLEVKTGLYGVLGGAVVTVISAFIQYHR
jgi:tetrahydromethanopterin S-methyltransferase subunit G